MSRNTVQMCDFQWNNIIYNGTDLFEITLEHAEILCAIWYCYTKAFYAFDRYKIFSNLGFLFLVTQFREPIAPVFIIASHWNFISDTLEGTIDIFAFEYILLFPRFWDTVKRAF